MRHCFIVILLFSMQTLYPAQTDYVVSTRKDAVLFILSRVYDYCNKGTFAGIKFKDDRFLLYSGKVERARDGSFLRKRDIKFYVINPQLVEVIRVKGFGDKAGKFLAGKFLYYVIPGYMPLLREHLERLRKHLMIPEKEPVDLLGHLDYLFTVHSG